MNSDKDMPLTNFTPINSRFITVVVEKDEHGQPRIVLTGPYMSLTGFKPGEVIEGIVQEGLISLLDIG